MRTRLAGEHVLADRADRAPTCVVQDILQLVQPLLAIQMLAVAQFIQYNAQRTVISASIAHLHAKASSAWCRSKNAAVLLQVVNPCGLNVPISLTRLQASYQMASLQVVTSAP
jgi:hypothetical protein